MRQKRSAAYLQSLIVAAGLAVLTVIEYIVAVEQVPFTVPLLVLLAIVKAALVVNYFMHVSRLWSQGEEH